MVKKKKAMKKKKAKKKAPKKASKKTAKKKKQQRKPTTGEVLEAAGKKNNQLFGVHGRDVVFCHLCQRYIENIEVLKDHLSKDHCTTLTEYQRSFSTDRINVTANTLRAAEFFDALSFRAMQGRWPSWFKHGEAIELPEDPKECAGFLLDSILLLLQEQSKELVMRVGIGLRNLLTHEALSGKSPAITITMVQAGLEALSQFTKQLTDLGALQVSARKANVASGPQLTIIHQDNRTQVAKQDALYIRAPASLEAVGGRAELQRGAALVGGLLTGNRDTHVPPTQVEKMEELERRIHGGGE